MWHVEHGACTQRSWWIEGTQCRMNAVRGMRSSMCAAGPVVRSHCRATAGLTHTHTHTHMQVVALVSARCSMTPARNIFNERNAGRRKVVHDPASRHATIVPWTHGADAAIVTCVARHGDGMEMRRPTSFVGSDGCALLRWSVLHVEHWTRTDVRMIASDGHPMADAKDTLYICIHRSMHARAAVLLPIAPSSAGHFIIRTSLFLLSGPRHSI